MTNDTPVLPRCYRCREAESTGHENEHSDPMLWCDRHECFKHPTDHCSDFVDDRLEHLLGDETEGGDAA